MELDALDRLAAEAFEGYVVRKDLALQFKGAVPGPDLRRRVPARPLLRQHRSRGDRRGAARSSSGSSQTGRSAPASRSCSSRAPASSGTVKLIDLVTARLDAKTDSYLATLRACSSRTCASTTTLVRDNERMLTGGFYAEVELEYDAAIAQEKNGRPFGIDRLRPIQLSTRDVLDALAEGASAFTTEEWKRLPAPQRRLRAASAVAERAQDVLLLRMVPFVERNYNMVELGPRGTGKSPPVPAGLAVRPPDLRRQGDRRADVREQRDRPARARLPSTTSSASTRSPASPSTRRTASTS